MLTIQLKFCRLEWRDFGCATIFPDGTFVNAEPHNEPHYYVIAHRCGYQDDIMAYCREHEFAHAFLAQEFFDRPSFVLQKLAQGVNFELGMLWMEEIAAQTFQRWLRAHEEPIISGVDWYRLKDIALTLLTGQDKNAGKTDRV